MVLHFKEAAGTIYRPSWRPAQPESTGPLLPIGVAGVYRRILWGSSFGRRFLNKLL